MTQHNQPSVPPADAILMRMLFGALMQRSIALRQNSALPICSRRNREPLMDSPLKPKRTHRLCTGSFARWLAQASLRKPPISSLS